MGSRPCRPVLLSVKFGLLPLVISEKTHRIWLVDLSQAKLTWLGSDATFGFWQAVVISFWTVATLAGHEAPGRNTTMTRTVMPTARTASPIVIVRARPNRPRWTLLRPWLMSRLVRSSAPRVRAPVRGWLRADARRAAVCTGERGPGSVRPPARRNDSWGGLAIGSGSKS